MNINTQLKTIIDNSQLYSCEELPSNSKASHIIKNYENNLVLPIKLYIENPSQTWVLLKSSYRGIIIVWITKENKSLVIHTNELKSASNVTSSILSKYKDSLCKFSDIPNKITNYYNKDHLIDITEKEPVRKPTQFQDIINNSKLYSCEELPLNCRASYIIKYKKGNKGDIVLPIKLYIETKAKRWNLDSSLYRGVVILWLTESEKSLVIHTNELRSLRTRSSSILLQYKDLLCDFSDIPNKIFSYYKKNNLIIRKEVFKNTKYEVLSREEIKNTRPDTNILEALAHEEITALLGENKYKLTPEKCKADSGYYNGDLNIDQYIGIQVKSATFQKNGKMNVFHNTNKYGGLLLFCRPMIRTYVGTFVIPGSLVETNEIGCSFTENSKYTSYLIPDPLLDNFMSGLYIAVINNENTYEWSSGKIVDISSLILKPFDEFCKPEFKTDIKENQSASWRKEKYPNLSYIVPKVQGTAVDIIINDVRLQDKHGSKFKGHIGYVVNLQKNGGRHKKNNNVPYEVGDFDGVFVFLNDTYKYIFVIPSFELEKRGILKSDIYDGLKCFIVYTSDYKKPKFGKEADLWTQRYCIDTEAEDSENNLIILIDKCKELNSRKK